MKKVIRNIIIASCIIILVFALFFISCFNPLPMFVPSDALPVEWDYIGNLSQPSSFNYKGTEYRLSDHPSLNTPNLFFDKNDTELMNVLGYLIQYVFPADDARIINENFFGFEKIMKQME